MTDSDFAKAILALDNSSDVVAMFNVAAKTLDEFRASWIAQRDPDDDGCDCAAYSRALWDAAVGSAVCANPTLEEIGFLREVLHHLDLFTKTTGGDPYVSVAATLLRNRIAGGSPAEPPCLGEQCANYPDGCSQCRHLERESLAEPR